MHEVFLRSRWLQETGVSDLDQGIAITHFPAVVGRSNDCDYQIQHPFISRRHCSFALRDGQIWVKDLASQNGTYLNGERLSDPRPLQDNDKLDLAFLPYRVCLPLACEGSVVRAGSVSAAPAGHCRTHKVLVVDDNADAAETLAMLLEKWGHHVQVAHDGTEAVQVARTHQPDTVFLDICLAGVDGLRVAQQLRQEASLNKAILVGITGYDPVETLERSQGSGLQQVLTKPVSTTVLQEVLS